MMKFLLKGLESDFFSLGKRLSFLELDVPSPFSRPVF